MTKFLPEDFIIDEYILSALKEDMFFGDITTDAVCAKNPDLNFKINLKSRQDGILCGRKVFERVFKLLACDRVEVEFLFDDGDEIKKDDIVAKIFGSAEYILKGERLALNFIQKMSGIATHTRIYQNKAKKYNVRVVDTRKNTPNFRIFEKYAVKIGGNYLHRFNLSDCVMLKDNHIALCGSITNAVNLVRDCISHAHKIEVECDTIEQVKEALKCDVDIIMLDNMAVDEMKHAVNIINHKAIVEASGCVTLDNIEEIASCGVDIISTSAIVMKAPTLDLGFDYIS